MITETKNENKLEKEKPEKISVVEIENTTKGYVNKKYNIEILTIRKSKYFLKEDTDKNYIKLDGNKIISKYTIPDFDYIAISASRLTNKLRYTIEYKDVKENKKLKENKKRFSTKKGIEKFVEKEAIKIAKDMIEPNDYLINWKDFGRTAIPTIKNPQNAYQLKFK